MPPKKREVEQTGYHTATPGIVVQDAAGALDFYQKALGARETVRMTGPDGRSIAHAEFKIGDSTIFLSDEVPHRGPQAPPTLGGTTGAIHLSVPDVDQAFERAVAAGAKPSQKPMDMFWGDRYAQVIDPFGHAWGLSTHKEDVPPDQMAKRAAEFYQRQAGSAGP